MEEKVKIEHLVSNVKEYAEERLKLIILNAYDKAGRLLSNTVSILILAVISFFVLLFVSFAMAWWIGQALEQPFLGFLIIGGVYLLLVLLVYVNREKWIRTPVINSFLNDVMDEDD